VTDLPDGMEGMPEDPDGMPDPVDGMDTWFDDEEVEALLAGARAERADLVPLERFLSELRAPQPQVRPEPSEDLATLFSGGPAASGLGAAAPAEPRRTGPAGRKPVRRMAKVAVATTTAALAVTLAAAAQVLPNTQAKTSISVSGPATPVRLGGSQQAATGTSEVSAGVGAGVTVQHPTTTATARVPATTRVAAPADVNSLNADALARLPLDILRTLPADVLVRLPMDVLRTLPADALARLPLEVLKTLPGDALGRLPADLLSTLPGDALIRLPGDILKTLPGDALARLPLDLLMTLPPEVQARLPVDVLRLLALLSPTPVTTATTSPPHP
jgi:hypothetical protein